MCVCVCVCNTILVSYYYLFKFWLSFIFCYGHLGLFQCYFDRICDIVFICITAFYLCYLCNFGLYYFVVYVKCTFVTKYKFVVFRDFLLEEFGCGIGVEAPSIVERELKQLVTY